MVKDTLLTVTKPEPSASIGLNLATSVRRKQVQMRLLRGQVAVLWYLDAEFLRDFDAHSCREPVALVLVFPWILNCKLYR